VLSMDLPFALRRYTSTKGLEHIIPLSDHRDASFGQAYGVLVKEHRLLARAAFVVDRQGTIRHVQYVPEMTEEPRYDRIWDVVHGLVG